MLSYARYENIRQVCVAYIDLLAETRQKRAAGSGAYLPCLGVQLRAIVGGEPIFVRLNHSFGAVGKVFS